VNRQSRALLEPKGDEGRATIPIAGEDIMARVATLMMTVEYDIELGIRDAIKNAQELVAKANEMGRVIRASMTMGRTFDLVNPAKEVDRSH
jgi:hypothetical protein